MSSGQLVPTFHDLPREKSKTVLARNHIGRIAYSFHDRVDIEPIGYVLAGEWIVGRTSPGSKLNMIGHNRWVAFEVDEVDSMLEWRSVVVHGAFYALDPDGSQLERQAWTDAVAALRAVMPDALTERDPVGFRTIVFRIAIDNLTGRHSSLGGAAG